MYEYTEARFSFSGLGGILGTPIFPEQQGADRTPEAPNQFALKQCKLCALNPRNPKPLNEGGNLNTKP